MNPGKHIYRSILCGLPLLLAACSGGTSTDTSGSVSAVVQDLGLDPDGKTTVVSFSQVGGSASAANFSADGGQTALSATISGNDVTVTWDERVTPSHSVSFSGLGWSLDGSASVSTSDSSAPTFTITDSTMGTGLGADTLEVTFSGPRVVEADAEDPSSWILALNSSPVDLSDSTFDLDPATGVLSISLGASASLHSTFTLSASSLTSVADVPLSITPVAGTASGDVVAPGLNTVHQNLADDEYGRTVDFQFDEAMDPTFSMLASNFLADGANIATGVTQPSAGLLRVTFAAPVIPGVHTVELSNMMDVHGNAKSTSSESVSQPSPGLNAYSSSQAVTVANEGGDYVVANFDQAFDETSATDPSSWTLVVDGNSVDMANQTLTYDFAGKSLRIDLDFDMVNGTAYTLTGVGVLEVDGETFSAASADTVSGDVDAPSVLSVVQNRVQDPSGQTLDVTFSEDLDGTAVANLANWTVSGLTVSNATLLGTPDVARLTLTGGPAVPGLDTLDVSNQSDLAGNAMPAPATGLAITSTDSTQPSVVSGFASAISGANNDWIQVTFDDEMVAAQVENPVNWAVEAPIGTSLDTTGATIVYEAGPRRATLTFDAGNGIFFKAGDDYQVTLSGMTDISGNSMSGGSFSGDVDYETDRPYAHSAYAESSINTEVVVYFNEPMDYLEDLWDAGSNVDGTRYTVRDSFGVLRGHPSTATSLDDGLGVRLGFGFVINAGDTIDVMGATDLVGNYMFPALDLTLGVESGTEPALNLGGAPLVAVSGEQNDTIEIVFDRRMNPWGILDPSNYDISTGGSSLDLTRATFEFDGDQTVSIRLDGVGADSLQAASQYDFSVSNLRSDQGVQMSVPDTALTVNVSGDITTGPTVGTTDVRLDRANPDSILVFADEALDPALAEDESRWNWNTGTFPTSATLIGPKTVRLTFASNPTAGTPLAYDVVDLAGNNGGATFRTVQAFETAAPVLLLTGGTSVAGEGGDFISVVFNEAPELSTGLNVGGYSVTNGGVNIPLTGTGAWFNSALNEVNFYLAAGYELDPNQAFSVTVSGVSDHSGNVMPAPVSLGGTIVGDTSTPPGIDGAFTNYRIDPTGLLVDVLFDEAPEETFVTNQFNWTVTGSSGQVVLGVLPVQGDSDVYRVVLSGALGAGEELEIAAGLPDFAGNVTVAPTTVTVEE